MRPGQGIRVFDRADWRRKVRLPARLRREASGGSSENLTDRKTTEKW
jgi:hypothetical protein